MNSQRHRRFHEVNAPIISTFFLIIMMIGVISVWLWSSKNQKVDLAMLASAPHDDSSGLIPGSYKYRGGEGEFVNFIMPERVKKVTNGWALMCPILTKSNPLIDPILDGKRSFSDYLIIKDSKLETVPFTLKCAQREKGAAIYIVNNAHEPKPQELFVLIRKKILLPD